MAAGTVLYEKKTSQLESDTEDNSSAAGDAWDDRALIEAYDEAAYLAKCRVAARMMSQGETFDNVERNLQNSISQPMSSKKSKKKNKKGKIQWEVGAPCRAVFSEDGCEYEATIQSVNQAAGVCIVKYIGYNNIEEVPITSLKPSQGAAARQYQIHQTSENLESENVTESDVEEAVHNSGTFEDSLPGAAMWTSPPRCVPYSNMRGPSARQQFHNSQNRMNIPIPPPPPPHLISQFPDEDSEALSAMLLSWYMSGFHTGYYQGLREAKNGTHSHNQNRMPLRKK